MCTLEKRGRLFLLTLTGEDEHRFSPTLIESLIHLLSEVKSQATPGCVLITTAQGKFFSNGFDLAWAQSAGSVAGAVQRLRHMVDAFRPVVAAFLALPLPTIAAVPGHAAAAGLALALCHDYVFMRRDRGVLYMSELDIGLTFPDYFLALMRSKISSPLARREVLLRAAKVKGDEAVKMGIVDSAHDSVESLMEAAVRLGEQLGKRKWDCEVYGEIRKSLYPELCGLLGLQHKAIVNAKPKPKL